MSQRMLLKLKNGIKKQQIKEMQKPKMNWGTCIIGLNVTRNYSEAIKWYQKAAEQGIASAQYKLGYMYYYGQGISQNR